jgi:hypothetical protein
MQQDISFPLTILLKDGKIKVVSMLSPSLTTPLIQRVIQELEVPYEDRYYAPETEQEESGEPNLLYEKFQDISADAICLLANDGLFIFMLSPAYDIHETTKYQQVMHEKLTQYMRQVQ